MQITVKKGMRIANLLCEHARYTVAYADSCVHASVCARFFESAVVQVHIFASIVIYMPTYIACVC